MSKKPCAKLRFRERSGHEEISHVICARLVLLKVSIISKVSFILKLLYHFKSQFYLKISIEKVSIIKS